MKNNILLLGAGKSSAHLIDYLAHQTLCENFTLTIMDINTSLISSSISDLPKVEVIKVETKDIQFYREYIATSTITISMLPAFMHLDIARMCLESKTHLITPSYISPEMKEMDTAVKSKDLIFLNEIGFDPGIDHMTTMKIYDELVEKGAILTSYKSYAGGLVAPKNDDNPWNYKFSWNPRNVILAGQGGEIVYKKDGNIEKLTYQNLYAKSENLSLSNGMEFDAYANRDSLKYEDIYDWENIQTLLRGTLRRTGFCEGWNTLIQLGLTDNEKQIKANSLTYSAFYQLFISDDIEVFISKQNENIRKKLISIGFTDTTSKIELDGTAAQILQYILEPKWMLIPNVDTDWVVMVHFFEFILKNKKYQLESTLSLEGEDAHFTAMSKTVGMPIAFAALMILRNEIKARGVILPLSAEIYLPVLEKLKNIGINFIETETEI